MSDDEIRRTACRLAESGWSDDDELDPPSAAEFVVALIGLGAFIAMGAVLTVIGWFGRRQRGPIL